MSAEQILQQIIGAYVMQIAALQAENARLRALVPVEPTPETK